MMGLEQNRSDLSLNSLCTMFKDLEGDAIFFGYAMSKNYLSLI